MKKLTQSVFHGKNEYWQYAAIDPNGDLWLYREEPKIDKGDTRWSSSNVNPLLIAGKYDASDWRNSLIKKA